MTARAITDFDPRLSDDDFNAEAVLLFGAAPLALLGRSSSTIVSREKTAVISRNGTSTTIRFRKVVTSISYAFRFRRL